MVYSLLSITKKLGFCFESICPIPAKRSPVTVSLKEKKRSQNKCKQKNENNICTR